MQGEFQAAFLRQKKQVLKDAQEKLAQIHYLWAWRPRWGQLCCPPDVPRRPASGGDSDASPRPSDVVEQLSIEQDMANMKLDEELLRQEIKEAGSTAGLDELAAFHITKQTYYRFFSKNSTQIYHPDLISWACILVAIKLCTNFDDNAVRAAFTYLTGRINTAFRVDSNRQCVTKIIIQMENLLFLYADTVIDLAFLERIDSVLHRCSNADQNKILSPLQPGVLSYELMRASKRRRYLQACDSASDDREFGGSGDGNFLVVL